MRGVYKFFLLSVISVSIFSCSTDPLPAPEPGFTVDKSILEVNVPATFTNTSSNAATYSWDFGDGQTSDEESPTIFYEEQGDYTVTLTATTTDNQSAESTMAITVGTRQLYEVTIQTLSFVNNDGGDWDMDDPDSTSFKFPDFWFVLGPNEDPNFEFTIGSGIVGDLSPNQLALVFSSNAGGITTLSDEDWTIAFYDFDGADINDVQPDDVSELMSFVGFNPVKDSEPDENGEGVISVSQGLYSVELSYKIE